MMALNAWWEKKVLGSETRAVQWRELHSAITRGMLSTSQALITNHLKSQGHPTPELKIYDYRVEEFLRVMTEIFPSHDEAYSHAEQFHLQLIAVTGKVIPMNLTEATTMVTKLFEISNQLNPTYVSNTNIIESFKKWVKLVKPHRDTIP